MAPRQQQGNSTFTEVGIPALGMDTDTVPRLLPPTKAPLLKNFLMDRPGVLPMRGPICEGTAWDAGSGIAPVGQWVFDDKVLVSRYQSTVEAPIPVAVTPADTSGTIATNTTLYYKVTTLNGVGETTPSAEVTATTNAAPAAPTGLAAAADNPPAPNLYYYKVVAYTGFANSPVSAEVSARSTNSGLFGDGGISVSWTAVAGATKYRVYRGTSSNGEDRYVEVLGGPFSDYPTGGTTSTNVTWIAGTPPAGAASYHSVALTWPAVTGATGYRVYRGTSSGGESVFFAPGLVTSFTDTGTAGTAGIPPTSNTATITASRDTWVAPYRKAASAGLLRVLRTTSKVVDCLNNTSSDLVAASADGVPGARSVRVGSFVYGHAGDATATVSQLGAVYKKTKLLKWDGSATPVAYTNGPQASQDITSHYNRLFVLGGIAQGGTAIQFNSLYWSDTFAADGTALPDTAAAWQDDVSGLVNQLVVGSDDSSDFGVAVAHVGANLLILKRRSLWMLYGTQPANFQIKQISNEVGCIDPRSVVEYDQGVYFMSDRGFMFFDGIRVQNVSTGLNSTLVASARRQCGPAGVDGGYVRAAKIGPGYILVTTGVVNGTALATTADSDAWLLHAPSLAWSQLSSTALGSVVGCGRSINYGYLISDQRLVRASYLFSPTSAPAGFRGLDSVDGSVTSFLIPSRWTTRALALGTPPRKSKLQRITADYYWSLANGGWQVTTTTRGKTGVVNSVGTLAAPTGIAAALPARGAIDIFNETDEVYLDIAASSSALATFNDAELHRVLIASEGAANVPASL